jgi:hypothetical protein
MKYQEKEVSMLYSSVSHATDSASEEVLVTDSRDGQTPAQVVERKLVSMLQGGQLLMSHLQTRRLRCPSA